MKNDTTEGVLDDLKKAADDAEDVLRSGAHEGGHRMQAAKAKLMSAIDSAKDTYHRLEDRAIAAGRATDRTIREHPYQSLGIAFAVGLLIGVLIQRNRH